jgi:hypothetical protein
MPMKIFMRSISVKWRHKTVLILIAHCKLSCSAIITRSAREMMLKASTMMMKVIDASV